MVTIDREDKNKAFSTFIFMKIIQHIDTELKNLLNM